MADHGKNIIIGIGIYLIIKGVLNWILGASLLTLIIPLLLAGILYFAVFEQANYAAAAVMILIALNYLPNNIRGLPGTWLYLAEGLIDFGAAAILIMSQDVKAYLKKN